MHYPPVCELLKPPFFPHCLYLAARAGSKEFLAEFLAIHSIEVRIPDVAFLVAKAGHAELLEWLRWRLQSRKRELTSQVFIKACAGAATTGRVELLRALLSSQSQWLLDGGNTFQEPPTSIIAVRAAAKNQLAVLEYLSKTHVDAFSSLVTDAAICNGHFDLVRWLCTSLQPPCPVDSQACERAALAGQWDIVFWLIETNRNPYNAVAIVNIAARNGNVAVLDQMYNMWQGSGSSILMMMMMMSSVCEIAARYNHRNIIMWARRRGVPWPRFDKVVRQARAGGHEALEQWLLEQGAE